MKKTFKYAAIALAFLCTGAVTTSCDSETLMALIGNLFNTGETYTYQGSATTECMDGSMASQSWAYINTSKVGTFSAMQCSLACNQTANLTIPAFTDGKVTTSAITLYNLTMTASSDNTYTILGIGDNSTIDGSMTVDGQAYTAGTVYIEKATATSGALSLTMTIYFANAANTDYVKAINFTYTGAAITTN